MMCVASRSPSYDVCGKQVSWLWCVWQTGLLIMMCVASRSPSYDVCGKQVS